VGIHKYHELSQSKEVASVQFLIPEGTMNVHRRNGVQAWLRIGYCRNSEGGIGGIHHRSVMIALLSLGLAAPGLLAAQSHQDSAHQDLRPGMSQKESAVPGLHDFDFLVGQWQAHHRKLKQRLANNHEWSEFEGTLSNQPLMGSYSNVDDTVLSVPGAPYRGVALRSFDPKTQQWSIWWLDSRTPSDPLDPPMIGGFHNGVGTFYGEDMVRGKRVRARFLWSNITPTSGHWEQADSPDEGKTWETNWVQDITRVR
jgi:hypothetical protein